VELDTMHNKGSDGFCDRDDERKTAERLDLRSL
jgi:hypothetical protein